MQGWDEDPTAELIGMPIYLPVEVELNILVNVGMDDTFKLEMVCRLWFYILRGADFREEKLALVCQQRIDRFPGYSLIPKFLEDKGWRYLIASKRPIVQGEEKTSLMLGTVSYDQGATIYEGFWHEAPTDSIGINNVVEASMHEVANAVPNGRGVLYHLLGDIPIVVSGTWFESVLCKGTVRRDGGLFIIINKYAGGGAWDGCFYCPDGERFEGLFFMKFPISYNLDTLQHYVIAHPRQYFRACLGQYYEVDGSEGVKINRLTPELQEAFKKQRELDNAQLAINAIPNKDMRIKSRAEHNKSLLQAQIARRRKEDAAARTPEQERVRAEQIADLERMIDEISDEDERTIVRNLNRAILGEVEVEPPPPPPQNQVPAPAQVVGGRRRGKKKKNKKRKK
jgi:hypothetical protein